jgi:hypothetical protein
MNTFTFPKSKYMKAFLAIFSFLLITPHAFCGWTPVNTGISDDFTSISFKGNVGFMTGKKGAYISTNVGSTGGTWTRVQNFVLPADSVIYNHSQFYSSVPANMNSNNYVYFCGRDTINSTGVIFRYNVSTNNLQLIHTGGSKFYKIAGKPNSNHIYAVGNSGILVYFSEANPVVSYIPTSYSFDLKSISIATNSLLIGTDDYLINGTIDNISPNIISFSTTYLPGRNFRDVIQIGSYSMYAVGKNYARKQSSSTITEQHQYYRDSLMGNSVTYNTNQVYIGTDNGIYKSYSSSNIMEFQPTSTGYTIYDIAYVTSTNLFACGSNGIILFTTNLGGTPEPYAQIDYNGGCLGTPQSISSTKGTVNSCYNYINNVLVTSTCSNYGYTFSTPGTHTIKLDVSNGTHSKTIIKTITIVAPPQINLSTDVLDTILCKQGTLDITVHNSENGIFYTLLKTGSSTNYATSGVGDGSDLNFQSITLNQTDNFYLRATNTSVPACYKNFTDVISMVVEKPVARVYFDIINAEVNEDVRFYQRCVNTSNFEWQFTNSPVLSTSNSPTPVNSFTGLGSSQVTLIAGTGNNCYDTTTVRGPFIYQPYSTDSSWAMVNYKIPNSTTQYYLFDDIEKTIKSVTGGYLVKGIYIDRVLKSRVGDSLSLSGEGSYLAKYNDFGVLKWCVKSKTYPNYPYSYETSFADIVEDHEGNLYISGFSTASGIVDNRGDSICWNRIFLVKLDSLGNTVWNRTTYGSDASYGRLSIDFNNNVYMAFGLHNLLLPQTLRLNDIPQDTISFDEYVCSTCLNVKMLKFNGSGQLVNQFLIELQTHVTGRYAPHLTFDSSNNMYLWGLRGSYTCVHEPSTGDTIVFGSNTSIIYSPNMYILKFDPTGNYLWKVEGKEVNNGAAVSTSGEIEALMTDEAGNLYLTGENGFNYYFPMHPQTIVSSDLSTKSFFGGKYFVAKINTDGITQWINGNYVSYYGRGHDLLLDGDTLYVVGAAKNNSAPLQGEVLGTNNSAVSFATLGYNYFIAKYDTNGTIHRLYMNGPSNANNGFSLDIDNNIKLIKLNDGYFLLNKSVRIGGPNQNPATDFGYTLNQTGFKDGIQIKLHPNQGIEVFPHYFQVVIDSVCYNYTYTFPNGSEIPHVTASFAQIDSLTASNGMDSIIRYEISVPPVHYSDNFFTICQGGEYEIPNDTTLTNIQPNYSYTQIISSPNACDSFAHYHFFVTPPPSSSVIEFIHACQGENVMLPDGSVVMNVQTSQQLDIALQSVTGCDSLVNFAIQVTAINADITPSGNSLLTNSINGASFQWVNCNANFAAIPGATTSVFTPTANGNYAVIITTNGCSDTSACFLFTNLSISELDQSISVFPNPTNGKALITFENTIASANITVYSGDGRKILETAVEGITKYELDLGPFEKGTYFVRIITEENKKSEFILVKN